MSYKELQEKAKELGLPYIGIPREELEKSINDKETPVDVVADEDTPREPQVAPGSKPKATAPAEVSLNEYNTAIVLNKGREVRRYSVEIHGEGFIELAKEFASKGKYDIEYKNVKPGIKCPACGHIFNPA